MAVLAISGQISPDRLETIIPVLLPQNIEGLYALLMREDRVNLTKHIPAASFAVWEHGIIFGESLQIKWRLESGGAYRVAYVCDAGAVALPPEFTGAAEAAPLDASQDSILLGELVRTEQTAAWHSPAASRPLLYPVVGKGARVLIRTQSYRLPDETLFTRFKGVAEC